MRSEDESINLVIFDCDGVLVDSEPLANEVLMTHLAEVGVELMAAECRRRFQGRSLASVATLVERDFAVALDTGFFERLQDETYARFRHSLTPVAGMHRLLEKLQVPWCIASSGGHDKMAVTLKLTGFDTLAGGRIFSAADVARGKPAPDLFEHAACCMQIVPHRCLVVEDSVVGIEAARAAGMRVIGFAGANPSELAATGAETAADADALARRLRAEGLLSGPAECVGSAAE